MPAVRDSHLRLVAALMFASLRELLFVRFKWTGSISDPRASLVRIWVTATHSGTREASLFAFSSEPSCTFPSRVPLLGSAAVLTHLTPTQISVVTLISR